MVIKDRLLDLLQDNGVFMWFMKSGGPSILAIRSSYYIKFETI